MSSISIFQIYPWVTYQIIAFSYLVQHTNRFIIKLYMRKQLFSAFAVLALVYLLQLTLPATHPYSFQDYQLQYRKAYTTSQQAYRKMIFQKNLRAINQHNADPSRTYEQGVNQFTDLTPSEFAHLYLSPIMADRSLASTPFLQEDTTQSRLGLSSRVGVQIDWVAAGKVQPVVDQGQCGASWAFSAVGAVESAYLIKGSQNISFSAQEILDCTGSYGNYGCNGGYMSSSFKYIKEKGINQEKNYPYTGKSQKCTAPTQTKWKISGYQGDTKGCDVLLNALANGPISVAVDATNFSSYKEGIITKCGNTPTSGALLVGATDTYWRIKLSFGVNFGDKGYVRIGRGNLCAICQMISYPQV